MLFPYDQPFQRGALMLFQYTHVGESAGGTFTIKIGGFRNRQDAAFTSNLGSQGSGFLGASEYRWKATDRGQLGAFLLGGGAPNQSIWYPGM